MGAFLYYIFPILTYIDDAFKIFFSPLLPNGGLKIGYLGPFSQFFTDFFEVFVVLLPKVTLKRKLFCTTYFLYYNTAIDDAFQIFFFTIIT